MSLEDLNLRPRSAKERPTCLSCRGGLGSTDAVLACDRCEAPLHWECWRELQRCPTPGCEGRAKHSDRLQALLAPFGPASPTIRPSFEDDDDPQPPPATTRPLPPRAPSPLRQRLRGYDPSAPLAVARAGTVLGFALGLVVALAAAPLLAAHHAWSGLALGLGALFAGPVLGGLYGALQGLLGLRHPPVNGTGWVVILAMTATGVAGYVADGAVVAAACALATSLLLGRLLGLAALQE